MAKKELKDKGLSRAQAHRLKESFQRSALTMKLLEKRAKEHNDDLLHDIVILAREEYDAIYRDMEGMLNGNAKK